MKKLFFLGVGGGVLLPPAPLSEGEGETDAVRSAASRVPLSRGGRGSQQSPRISILHLFHYPLRSPIRIRPHILVTHPNDT